MTIPFLHDDQGFKKSGSSYCKLLGREGKTYFSVNNNKYLWIQKWTELSSRYISLKSYTEMESVNCNLHQNVALLGYFL